MQRIQGMVESILLALFDPLVLCTLPTKDTVLSYLAISMAPADQGLVKIIDGFGAAGVPGCSVEGDCGSFRSVGER